MTARGVDFLNDWVSEKLPAMPTGDNELVQMLVQKLKDDAGAAGFTVTDLEIENSQVEQFMGETLIHVAEPGTPGD